MFLQEKSEFIHSISSPYKILVRRSLLQGNLLYSSIIESCYHQMSFIQRDSHFPQAEVIFDNLGLEKE